MDNIGRGIIVRRSRRELTAALRERRKLLEAVIKDARERLAKKD